MKESATLNINFEKEKRKKVLLAFLDKAKNINAFHRKSIETIFKDEESKREFIKSIKLDDFISLLNGTNGILRGKQKEEWKADGERVGIESGFSGSEYKPPRPEDKGILLDKALQACKRMNGTNRDIKDIALLICSIINALHLYADANGRTSRLIYILLTENYKMLKERDLLEKALKEEEGRDLVDINPSIIQGQIESLIAEEIGLNEEKEDENIIMGLWVKDMNLLNNWSALKFKEGTENKKNFVIRELLEKDELNMIYAFAEYCMKNEQETKRYIENKSFLVDSFFKQADQEDIDKVIELYRDKKVLYINTLIDIIENPNKKKYIMGNRMSLMEYYKNEIKRNKVAA